VIVIGLILISLVTGVIFLAYWIPKRLGYPIIGKYISIILILLLVTMTTLTVFEDELFSKSDAQKLLIEQDIQITDNFDIEKNISMSAPGDYYHTFTLKITLKDKKEL
jgi:hypothetical protein